jgi:hypothetical protein
VAALVVGGDGRAAAQGGGGGLRSAGFASPFAAASSSSQRGGAYGGGAGSGLGDGVASSRAPPAWLIVICEHRTLLFDYVTRAAVDVPHAALLVEASGAQRVLSKGRPGVHSASLVGPGTIAFGCEDGCVLGCAVGCVDG